jgi:hypothetical protein
MGIKQLCPIRLQPVEGSSTALARAIQASLMLVLLLGGLVLYRRWRSKINYTDFSLGMFYAFILVFFMSSPYTFMYYYLPFCMISAVVCGKVMVGKR